MPMRSCLLAAVLAIVSLPATAQEPTPMSPMKPPAKAAPENNQAAEDNKVELSIPSNDGKVAWGHVADVLGESLKLDADTLRQLLPTGEIDLQSGGTLLSLMAINFATSNAIEFSLDRDLAGQPVLVVRCDRNWFGGRVAPAASRHSSIDVDPKCRTTTGRVVVMVHGLRGEGKSFDDFRAHLRDSDFATASVDYDFDQSITNSARQIAELIAAEFKGRPCTLVGHSMGGLVARQIVEDPQMPTTSVDQVITLASPHRGSSWATLPPMLNLVSGKGIQETDLVDLLLHQPSSAGLVDLMPESDWMKAMSKHGRHADVKYTSVIGTSSPMDGPEIQQLRSMLIELDQEGSFVRLIRPRIDPLLSDFDEIESGTGDGVVSVSSATLAGIDDNVRVDRSHFDMIDLESGDTPNPVWELVRERLR